MTDKLIAKATFSVIRASIGVNIMQAMNAKKTLNTQILIDCVKSFNLSKIRNTFFINEHTSCPDHNGKVFVYKGLQALTFAIQYRGKANGCAIATATQWKSVPKSAPVNTIRLGMNQDNGQPVVHTQSLFAYNRQFSVTATFTGAPDLSVLKKEERNLVEDWINFRLGKSVPDRNHRLSISKVNQLLQFVETYFTYDVELIDD